MAIDTSFVIASPRALDEARKKSKRKNVDLLDLLADANVDLGWSDLHGQRVLQCIANAVVENDLDRGAFMQNALPMNHYVLFQLPHELVESLADMTDRCRAKVMAALRAEGLDDPERTLAKLEPIAKRAGSGAKSLYFVVHVPR